MLKKRIIPCLDIKDGRTVKGVNFINLKDAGDPIMLAKKYVASGADELVFLDISATQEKRKTLCDLVKKIAKEINIPFTVGGGVKSLEDAMLLIESGADKVSLNSAAVKNPKLITEISNRFGSQCVVVAIDTNFFDNTWWVYTHGGKKQTKLKTLDWAKQVESLGAGEILLTSMASDGTKNGFSLDITTSVSNAINLPVIASGGAGSKNDFLALFNLGISAGLAASVFHFNTLKIPALKHYLMRNKIAIRN